MASTSETWVDVVGYGGEYQVSDQGRVKSLKSRTELILSPGWNTAGYLFVQLWSNNKAKTHAIHTLVGQHFLPPPTIGATHIDHIDRNKHNNAATNLRWVTPSQNLYNARSRGGSSVFKGVSFFRRTNKWKVEITANGQHHHIGYFINENDAARAYDAAARQYHGPHARYNFPLPGELSALRAPSA